jgi:ABC-2 type transport system permease protein
VSPARTFYWLVRRELWEYRSIYIAPLIVAALFLLGDCISFLHVPGGLGALESFQVTHNHRTLAHYDVAAGLIMGAAFLITIFYSLGALSNERGDRSILFWKSMPVSDLTTVLSKAAIPIFVIPLIAFAVTFLTQWAMLLISSAVYAFHGLPAAEPWMAVHFFSSSLGLLSHLLLIHGLWYAPFYAWLLLVSAWARRAPFLWAALPILVIAGVEKIVFNTTYFLNFLGDRIGGGGLGDPFVSSKMAMGSMGSMEGMTLHEPMLFFVSPGLWIGLLVAGAMLYGASRCRRYRGPL